MNLVLRDAIGRSRVQLSPSAPVFIRPNAGSPEVFTLSVDSALQFASRPLLRSHPRRSADIPPRGMHRESAAELAVPIRFRSIPHPEQGRLARSALLACIC